MAGASLELDVEGLVEVREFLERVQSFDRRRLFETLAFTVENQVRRRISEEKEGPQGPWAPWSPRYAKSRIGKGGSLLQRSGGLLDSITSSVDEDEARIGTGKKYGATHQFGRGGIPARPFLWFSQANIDDLRDQTLDFLERTALKK